MAEIKAETRRGMLAEGPFTRAIMHPAIDGGSEMNVIGGCLGRALRVVVVLCSAFWPEPTLLAQVAEASEGPGSILRVWPLEGGGPGTLDRP
jgi:hypothetical protein